MDIGKSTAKALGSSLRNKQRHLTSLLAAGAGAGVAAGFNAPIAGGWARRAALWKGLQLRQWGRWHL